ncbi:hypothetical protein HRR83_006942 [Exophiala dermatitidis]|uniref:Uncharacterized protein n=1 Tax=Exophiala dermatitidis TaxID=5970 RepID=A0AAN6EQW4_EXODE|nr:hypothetical protein HRR73_005981 [Exophiala dermatitidis]KAJ4512699.1 hypothetical protein HRR74_006397 [Exophiala dermatitidis]KAJ4542503.1 hypothetical protein HRR77_005701 [Exophiala dermatitidis]KAJ4548192.1 hypothetical protein HRR76_000799 [Exophiala dermatitidis]KAJ4570273.1 hypothetical protein HRR82_007482 [Exophiala dermatitidis]
MGMTGSTKTDMGVDRPGGARYYSLGQLLGFECLPSRVVSKQCLVGKQIHYCKKSELWAKHTDPSWALGLSPDEPVSSSRVEKEQALQKAKGRIVEVFGKIHK